MLLKTQPQAPTETVKQLGNLTLFGITKTIYKNLKNLKK
jgi:hypothetical protein